MIAKNYFIVIKISVVLLSIAIVCLAVKSYDFDNQIKKLNKNIELDKKIHNNEMNEILIRYDSVLIKNLRLEEEIDEISNGKPESESVLNYDQSIKKLQSKTSTFEKGVDIEQKQLATLNSILKSKQLDIENSKEEIFCLNSKITKLQAEIKTSVSDVGNKKLKAFDVSAIGAKIVVSKVIETKKISNTEKIKVCFTLEDNPLIENGEKDIFIQIINPKSNIVSKNPAVLEIKNKTLFYSAKTSVNYGKEDVDVCVYVDANKNNLIKGNYIVNIFSGIHLIGNTNLTLN